MSPSQGATD